jgi:hypothetical protein
VFQPRAAAAAEKKEKGGILYRLYYEPPYWQTTHFMGEFVAPLVFLFATLSLILSAMQVVLAATSAGEGDRGGWDVFAAASAWFSVAIVLGIVGLLVGLGAVAVIVLLCQFQYGYRSWKRSRAEFEVSNVEGRGNGELREEVVKWASG